MEHYYTKNPTSKSNEKIIKYKINNIEFSFVTDNGVFSKKSVDFATDFMLKTVLDNEIKGNVLDIGCGYGVIGIVISKMLKSNVTMSDINERAINLTNKNIELNGIKNVSVIVSDGYEKIFQIYDTIITNPPIRAGKEVIYEMYKNSKDYLNNGGIFYLVINKKHGAPSTINFLTQLFNNCEVIGKKSGFNVIKCIKE